MIWDSLWPRSLRPSFPCLEISAVMKWNHCCYSKSNNPQSHLHLTNNVWGVCCVAVSRNILKRQIVPVSFSSLSLPTSAAWRALWQLPSCWRCYRHAMGMTKWGAVCGPGHWNFMEQSPHGRKACSTYLRTFPWQNTLIVPNSLLFTVTVTAEPYFNFFVIYLLYIILFELYSLS